MPVLDLPSIAPLLDGLPVVSLSFSLSEPSLDGRSRPSVQENSIVPTFAPVPGFSLSTYNRSENSPGPYHVAPRAPSKQPRKTRRRGMPSMVRPRVPISYLAFTHTHSLKAVKQLNEDGECPVSHKG